MPPEKKAPPAKWYDQINHPATFLIFIFILTTLAAALASYLASFNTIGSPEFAWFRIKNWFLLNIWPVWKVASAVISALAIYGIVHNVRKIQEISRADDAIFNPPIFEPEITPSEMATIKKFERNEKWEKVINYMNSTSPSDWRLAIMEADVMLEELLRTLGFHGDSVGEMLKSADKNEFSTLDDAWEAHKIRNAIAHAGTGFDLNERETKRVVALFEKVFKEFGVI